MRRAISLILVGYVFLAGCGWTGFVYRPISWKADDLREGMRKEDVGKLFGKPESGNEREWMYSQYCRVHRNFDEFECEGSYLGDVLLKLLRGIFIVPWFLFEEKAYIHIHFDYQDRVTHWHCDSSKVCTAGPQKF